MNLQLWSATVDLWRGVFHALPNAFGDGQSSWGHVLVRLWMVFLLGKKEEEIPGSSNRGDFLCILVVTFTLASYVHCQVSSLDLLIKIIVCSGAVFDCPRKSTNKTWRHRITIIIKAYPLLTDKEMKMDFFFWEMTRTTKTRTSKGGWGEILCVCIVRTS